VVEERGEEGGEVGIVADEKKVLGFGAVAEELLEVAEGGLRSEGGGEQDLAVVAGLGADERGGLEAALEGAGDDEIELDVESVEDVGELEAVLLAVLVERAFDVEERVGAAGAGAGVPKQKEVHRLFRF